MRGEDIGQTAASKIGETGKYRSSQLPRVDIHEYNQCRVGKPELLAGG